MTNNPTTGERAPLSYRREVIRKTIDLSSLIIPMAAVWWNPFYTVLIVTAGAILGLTGDIARARFHPFHTFIDRIFGPIMRRKERAFRQGHIILNGATWALMGAVLVFGLFPLSTAVPAYTVAVIADTAAALVGVPFGRRILVPPDKSVAGTSASFAAGFAAALFLPFSTLPLRIASAIAGSIIELIPLPINDNVSMPLACALTIEIGQMILA